MRYFVELELPTTAIEAALDRVPAEWLVAMANKAHARALGFMLEVDPHLGDDLAGTVVEVGMEPAVRHRSTTIRTMTWAIIGPQSAKPLLEADLEVGSLGDRGCQLAVAGRYSLPGAGTDRRIDRGMAQRVGEATIKEFVDGLADLVQKLALALGVPAPRLALADARGSPLRVV